MKRFLPLFAATALVASSLLRATDTAPIGAAAAAPSPSAAPVAPAAPVVPATTIASDQNYRPRLNYQAYFGDYLALKNGKRHELIFIGDSITEQWRWGAGSPVWKKHFEERAFNFGLGSDRTQHTIWRLQNIDLSWLAPKVAVVLIGTNNTGDTPGDIAAGVKAVIDATTAKFAGIKVVVLSILPNARATAKMAEANALIAPLADGRTVFHLDLAAKFTLEGDNWKGLSRDKLHLSAEGYEVWATELEALLPALLK